MKDSLKKFRTFMTVLILFIWFVTVTGCGDHTDSLEEINDNLLRNFYRSDQDVFNALDNYFKTRPIPDSIAANIDSLVSQEERDYKMPDKEWDKNDLSDLNPYEMESELTDLVRAAFKARLNSDTVIYRQYMERALWTGVWLTKSFSNPYWQKWIEHAALFTPDQAQSWLKAEIAQKLCRKYHDKLNFGPLAEYYGAYALRSLQMAADKRLELDVYQRLQVYLFYYYPFHQLSVSLANVNFQESNKIGYYLRSTGFLYHKAESLHFLGETGQAVQSFLEVIEASKKHPHIPYISWFDLHSRIYLASCYIDNDQLLQAEQVCQELEKYDLNDIQKTQLHILYGLVYRVGGQYERAEMHYLQAERIIDANHDYYNKIVIYNNLGFLYYQLTEYRKSLQFLHKGRLLIDKYQKHNIEYKSRILLAEAGNYRALGLTDSAGIKLDLANNAIKELGINPALQSELLTRSGEIYFELGSYTHALQSFQRADSLSLTYGLVKYYLDMMAMKISALSRLERYDDARRESERLLVEARKNDNKEKMIAAYAGLAESAYGFDNLELAVDLSEKMLMEMETLSAGYKRSLRLTSLRQKLYDFAKQSVKYEIESNHIPEAFLKLGYAKARALNRSMSTSAVDLIDRTKFLNADKISTLCDRIKPKSVLLDYFISEDTLYVFIIEPKGLYLFRKRISAERLKFDVQNYLSVIKEAISLYDNYDSEKITDLYQRILKQGHQLYESLLLFQGLDTLLDNCNHLYIIKDEFLHQLPFATLVLDKSGGGEFLIEKTAVTNIPSNHFVCNAVTEPRKRENQDTVLLSADYAFQGVDKLVRQIIKQNPEYKLLSSSENTNKVKVLNQLQGSFGKLIFIGHGLSNPDFPELSELIIRQENKFEHTPPVCITLGDLFRIGYLDIDLAILLGCKTAQGKLYRGSGMMGFNQGLLSLGINSVIGTYWNIDAVQSINCAVNLFSDDAEWSDPASCLRAAQLKMIQELKRDPYFKFPQPYFWGSFSYTTTDL